MLLSESRAAEAQGSLVVSGGLVVAALSKVAIRIEVIITLAISATGPNSRGTSRRGAPDRKIQNMPLRT